MNIFNRINCNLFNLSNKKYIKFVEKLIICDTFQYLINKKKIGIFYLNKSDISKINLIDFNLIQFKFEKNSLPKNLVSLVNINIKNRQTYELIKTIEYLQKDFIYSNNILDLKYFSYKDILDIHYKMYKKVLISSHISNIVKNITDLKELVPARHFVLYNQIKYIVSKYENLTDKQISNLLQNEFNTSVKSKTIFNVRKKYNIPNKKNRKLTIYSKYKFSKQYKLNLDNIKDLKNIKAVYELLDFNTTIYIGSTKDLKRRLYQYISNKGHTKAIREYIKRKKIYFRYLPNYNYKNLEKDILNTYYNHFGKYPILNHNKIL